MRDRGYIENGTYVPLAKQAGAIIVLPTDGLAKRGGIVLSAFRDLGSYNRSSVANFLQQLWNDEHGQDIAEYAVMLAVILVIVVGTIRLIGSNANNVFSKVGSAIQ